MEYGHSFGEWLKRWRRAQGLTREALAELVSCAPPTLAKIEQGTRRPSRELAALLLDALDAPACERQAILQLARMPLSAGDPAAPANADDAAASLAPHALPAAPSPLIGRIRELQQLRERLADSACRVVTLVAPGGIGKTRLALAAATELDQNFRDGSVWVELATLQDASALAPMIARAVGCPVGGTEEIAARLLAFLRERQMLLVLDNLEQLPDATPLLTAIVRQAPRATLLLTSRQRLRLPGEWALPLAGLPLPASDWATGAEDDGAARLFLERMRQAGAIHGLDRTQRESISQICTLVEGSPLAIELAAAWTRALSCVEIAAELARSQALLAEPAPTRSRHGSMQAVFDQSWALLSASERRALAALSILPGSFTREAAEQVAGVSLPTLASLIEQSLLRRDEDQGLSRYRLHTLVRQYAAERLGPAEGAAAQAAHAVFFTGLLETGASRLQGAGQVSTLTLLERERANILQAWSWAAEHGDEQLLARCAPGLLLMHELRGRLREAAALFAEAAARRARRLAADARSGNDHGRGVLCAWEGWARGRCGEITASHELIDEAIALLADNDMLLATTGAYGSLGLLLLLEGRYAEAAAALERSLVLVTPRGFTLFATIHTVFLLNVRLAQGEFAEAARLGALALQLGEQGGNLRARVVSRCGGALAANLAGRPEQAHELAREALSLAATARDPFGLGLALLMLGAGARLRGELEEARYLLIESVETCQSIGDRWNQCRALVQLGSAELAHGDETATRAAWAEALHVALAHGINGVAASAAVELAALAAAQGSVEALPLLATLAARPETEYGARRRAAGILAERPVASAEPQAAETLAGLIAGYPALVT